MMKPSGSHFIRHKVPPLPEATARPHEARTNPAREPRVAGRGALPKVVVAIPVRNEVDTIENCLRGLSEQEGAAIDRVVLLLNNCTDRTADRIGTLRPKPRVSIEIVERDLRGPRACAGFARNLAVQHALNTLEAHDVLLTTDADAVVASDWIARRCAPVLSVLRTCTMKSNGPKKSLAQSGGAPRKPVSSLSRHYAPLNKQFCISASRGFGSRYRGCQTVAWRQTYERWS
jgi:glycosyltransferase involved in cell wall biosynthesis